MNRLTILLAAAAIACASLTGCATTGSVDPVAVVRVGAQYVAAKELAKAKTPQAWEGKHARIDAVKSAFQVINGGLTPAAARALIATELDNDPDKMLLVDLVLALAPADAATAGLHNDWIQAVITGLDWALLAPMPNFPPGP